VTDSLEYTGRPFFIFYRYAHGIMIIIELIKKIIMEQELLQKLEAQDQKIDLIYESVEKTRKYFLWTMIGTLVTFVLPLIGLMFALPAFINVLSSSAGL
jgi:hypothetical protein